jgi:hypothetical protein
MPVEGARLTGREVDMMGPPPRSSSGAGSGDRSRGDGLGDRYAGA